MKPKKDLLLSAIVGLISAFLIWPIMKNLPIPQISPLYIIVALPMLCVIGMIAALTLGKVLRIIYQLAKFVLVGALNTFVDWGILNLLMFLANVSQGPEYSVFKGCSFLVATMNSYFWNKFWTFEKESQPAKKMTGKEMLQFFIVSLIGFGLNVGAASLLVNVLGPQFGLDPKIWANVGALSGTLAGLVWNFIGYKLIVFKS